MSRGSRGGGPAREAGPPESGCPARRPLTPGELARASGVDAEPVGVDGDRGSPVRPVAQRLALRKRLTSS